MQDRDKDELKEIVTHCIHRGYISSRDLVELRRIVKDTFDKDRQYLQTHSLYVEKLEEVRRRQETATVKITLNIGLAKESSTFVFWLKEDMTTTSLQYKPAEPERTVEIDLT